jgi:hypothetical protein
MRIGAWISAFLFCDCRLDGSDSVFSTLMVA